LGWGLGGFLDVTAPAIADAAVVNETTTQIKLELELDGETVSGHTIDAEGRRRPFSGWIGLMGVLDALLDRARSAGRDHSENHGTERD